MREVYEAFATEFRRVKKLATDTYAVMEHLDRMALHGLAMLLRGPGPH